MSDQIVAITRYKKDQESVKEAIANRVIAIAVESASERVRKKRNPMVRNTLDTVKTLGNHFILLLPQDHILKYL